MRINNKNLTKIDNKFFEICKYSRKERIKDSTLNMKNKLKI